MTYRQLQNELKTARQQGRIPSNFKLNQKHAVLLAAWEELSAKEAAQERAALQEENTAIRRNLNGLAHDGEQTLLYIDGGIPAYEMNFEEQFELAKQRITGTLVPVTRLGAANHDAATVVLIYA